MTVHQAAALPDPRYDTTDSFDRHYLFLVDPPRELFREVFREDLRDGTFAPFLRASFSPIAIACFRLFTFRPDPLFSVPFFLRRMVDSTFFDADFPYFAILTSMVSACKARADEPVAADTSADLSSSVQ